jgi:hypothetical protein
MNDNFGEAHYKLWKARKFEFHTGEVFEDLFIGYTTIGNPIGAPVLVMSLGDYVAGPGMHPMHLNHSFGKPLEV